MEVKHVSNNTAELVVEKTLDLSNSNDLKNALVELLEQGISSVRLDFSITEEIDSSGLGKLLLFKDLFSQRGGQLKVINVENEEIQKLFKLIQIDKVIDIDYR